MWLSRISRAAFNQSARVLNRHYSLYSWPFLVQSQHSHQRWLSSVRECSVRCPQQLACFVQRSYSSKPTDGTDKTQQTENLESKDTTTSNSSSSSPQSDTVPTTEDPGREEVVDSGEDDMEDIFAPRAVEIFKELSEIDSLDLSPPEKERKKAQLELELLFERLDVEKVTITERHIEQFMSMPSRKARHKFVDYMVKTEYKKRISAEKKAARQQQRAELLKSPPPKSTTFQPMIWDLKMERFYGSNLVRSMKFGSDLVFDFSYEDDMQYREKINLAYQFGEAWGVNRQDTEPFHVHLVNLRPDSQTYAELRRSRGNEENFAEKMLGTVTEKSYLELFPKDKLVYLSSDSPRELRRFEPDKVYIIGALVDRDLTTNLSYAKVKREGLASAALPLDRYLRWGLGTKALTLDQMMKIMLTLKRTNDFEAALRHVPTRKHYGLRSELAKMQMKPGMRMDRPYQSSYQRKGQGTWHTRERREPLDRVHRRKAKAWFED